MVTLTQSLFDNGPFAPCPEHFNLADYVLNAGRATPDKPALEIFSPSGKTSVSHAELRHQVMCFAKALEGLELPEGAVILLRIGHDILFPIAFLGAIAAGFVPVPTSADLTRAEVLKLAEELQPNLTLFGPGAPRIKGFPYRHQTTDDLNIPEQAHDFEAKLGDPNRLAYIIYTSGTSGRAMAVQHAHRAIWARRMMWRDWYDLSPSDRVFHAGAFNWTFTLGTGLLDPWSIGATSLIAARDVDHSMFPDLIATSGATIFAAAPGVYRRMLKERDLPALPDLRHCLSAGEKMPPTLRADWKARTGQDVFEALGMSEVSTFISQPAYETPKVTSAGRPQQGRRVAVLDRQTLDVVALETPGILALDRFDPGLMLGYRYAPAETAAKFHNDWFLTGDTVSMDASGAITYLGRADDMMNAGGFRVSPLEVETAFLADPRIREAAAFEAEVRENVYVIALAYVADQDIESDALEAIARQNLATYKRPRLYQRLDSLPKGANNKIKRSALRALNKA